MVNRVVGGWALGAVLVTSAAQAGGTRFADMTEPQVDAVLAEGARMEDLGARLVHVTEPFLGTPYVLGNMGEGPDGDGRDKDPRFNLQAADCTTFVEHAMAFALSSSTAEARRTLDAIRYDHGRVNYGTRRHWPEAQWVRGLVDEGFLEDVTVIVAGGKEPPPRAEVMLDVAAFKASAHAAGMPLRDDEVPVGTFSVPYVPLQKMKKAAPRLRSGMIINIVKEKKDGLLVRISHQGLVVVRGKDVFIRHASSVGPKSVMDEPLDAFLKRQAAAKSWPTAGFQFMRLLPRAAPAATP